MLSDSSLSLFSALADDGTIFAKLTVEMDTVLQLEQLEITLEIKHFYWDEIKNYFSIQVKDSQYFMYTI